MIDIRDIVTKHNYYLLKGTRGFFAARFLYILKYLSSFDTPSKSLLYTNENR